MPLMASITGCSVAVVGMLVVNKVCTAEAPGSADAIGLDADFDAAAGAGSLRCRARREQARCECLP